MNIEVEKGFFGIVNVSIEQSNRPDMYRFTMRKSSLSIFKEIAKEYRIEVTESIGMMES